MYDKRKGTWTTCDKAVVKNAKLLRRWLTKERVDVELSLLNHPSKMGPPFNYPPSLVCFVCLLKEDTSKSYRDGTASSALDLEALGFEGPCYSTIHKTEGRFEKDGSATTSWPRRV